MPTLSLYVREKTPAGTWRYRRIKEGGGNRDRRPLARPFVNGRQKWKTLLGQSFTEAKEEANNLAVALHARSKGLTVSEAESLTGADRIPIKNAVDHYLEQKSGKAIKTVFQYRLTLNEFMAAIGPKVKFLDEITENVLRSYKKSMVAKGYAGRRSILRLNIVFFLLRKERDHRARIPRDSEMPVVEEEVAVPYSEEKSSRNCSRRWTTKRRYATSFFSERDAETKRSRLRLGMTSILTKRRTTHPPERKMSSSRRSRMSRVLFRYQILSSTN